MKIAAFAISIFAILFSGGSLYFTYEANKISKKAEYQASRPKLQFSLEKYPNGRYYYYQEHNGKINLEMQLAVHNNGNSPAIKYKYIKHKVTLEIIGKEFIHSLDPLKTNPSIGPKQKLYRIFSKDLVYNQADYDKLKVALKNHDLNLILEVMAEYFDSSNEHRHTTYALYDIEKSNVTVKEYEEK